MDKLEEDKIIEKAKNGDIDAQGILFNKYKQLVNNVARHYFLVGGDNEDLVQEGMIGLYFAINSYDPNKNASFGSFARVVIESKVINAIKQDNAQKNMVLNKAYTLSNQGGVKFNTFDPEVSLPSNKETPENIVLSYENEKDIEKIIIDTLSDYEYKVLNLYLSGLNYVDIATQLNTSTKSIDNALSRIKSKLQFLKERD